MERVDGSMRALLPLFALLALSLSIGSLVRHAVASIATSAEPPTVLLAP